MTAPSHDSSHLVISDDLASVARDGAELFVRLAQAAAPRGRFSVALSGGNTPREMHALLTRPPYISQVDWAIVQFYWGDDRCVNPDDPQSNYHMARETLLDALPISPSQVHRIHTEERDPATAAALYAEELRQDFRLAPSDGRPPDAPTLPRFDLVYLGMGDDGHTLSLFPHTSALGENDRLVVANEVPKLGINRITLTAPVVNNAAAAAFLIAGPDKAAALAAVLQGPRDPDEYPSQLIHPTNGELYWYVDRAAAAQLAHPA
ncbi:MAG TPA: 6-phosphogluconolactonase [Ktedonobacterales bacterium]